MARAAGAAKVQRPVNIIVHTLDDVNKALQRGEYFWVDIVRDGVVLYELPQHALAAPKPLTAADAHATAERYFKEQRRSAANWLRMAELALAECDDRDWRNKAAFNLHQATETAYAGFLLVRTLDFPRSHNLKFLRSLAEDKDARLIDARCACRSPPFRVAEARLCRGALLAQLRDQHQ